MTPISDIGVGVFLRSDDGEINFGIRLIFFFSIPNEIHEKFVPFGNKFFVKYFTKSMQYYII